MIWSETVRPVSEHCRDRSWRTEMTFLADGIGHELVAVDQL